VIAVIATDGPTNGYGYQLFLFYLVARLVPRYVLSWAAYCYACQLLVGWCLLAKLYCELGAHAAIVTY